MSSPKIAKERLFKITVDGKDFVVKCSPDNLEELALGIAKVEGLKEYKIEPLSFNVDFKVKSKVKWSLEELENYLSLIDLHDPTKAHHTAVIIGKSGMIARAVDISRHNAIFKVIGMAVKRNIDFGEVFLLLSCRVTFDIAYRCAKVGIPLLVTKKAVTDLALELCKATGLSLVSFGSGIAMGDAVEHSNTGRW